MRYSSIIFALAASISCFLPPLCRAQGQGGQGFTSDPNLIQQEILGYLETTFESTPPDELIILRLDQLADALVQHANETIDVGQDRITYVMNGLKANLWTVWNNVLLDPVTQQVDLSIFVAAMLGLLPGEYGIDPYPNFLESRQAALQLQADRGNLYFPHRIEAAFQDVQNQLGVTTTTTAGTGTDDTFHFAPIYQITYGYEHATNAKTTRPNLEGVADCCRCVILLNIGAQRMLDPDVFQIAATHETWHCYSGMQWDTESENNLLKIAMREGVATYLTSRSQSADERENQQFAPKDLLFWSRDEFYAAQERNLEILTAFSKLRNETDFDILREWIYLNIQLSAVPGAPSRCAYYVAWIAFQLYVEDQEVPPSALELLALSNSPEGREQVWRHLALSIGIESDTGYDGIVDTITSGGIDSSNYSFQMFIGWICTLGLASSLV